MRESPAYLDAKRDRTLRGATFFVYVWLDEHLDTVEFRYVKHAVIGRELAMGEYLVSRAIRRLLERRYIQRGPRDGRMSSYRLYHSRSSAAAIPVKMQEVAASTPERMSML